MTTTHTTVGLHYAGANFLSPALLSLSVPTNRVGGDDQTVYNPYTDSSNADNDFFWANGSPYRPFQQLPAKNQSFVEVMIRNSITANSTLFMLLPLAGWVANGVADCASFPIAEYGHQQKEWTKYGNGVLPNGTLLSGDWRCYVPFGLDEVLRWVAELRKSIGAEAFDSHVVLQLDNEYDLWGFVHRDIHPAMVSYDELWAFTVTYASALKHQYPNIRIAGPISYGWCGWWWSELDGCVHNGTDYKSHHNMYLMPWFLSQLESYYQQTGIQLIDIIDNHHYPTVPDNDNTPANRAQFFDEVRSWYDPHYIDPGWIGQCGPLCGGPSLSVIPRYYAWIARYAPSLALDLAFSEYAFGFNDSSETEALASLETLAVLGAYNVTWGMRWISPEPGSLAEEVWRLWFDFDGKGGTLTGDFALTTSSMQPNVTAYTTYDRPAQRVHVLVVSHMEGEVACTAGADDSLTLPLATTSASTAQTYQLAPGKWKVSAGPVLKVSMGTAVTVADAACGMAGRSVRLIVVEGVKVTSEMHHIWRPWTDQAVGVAWDQPFDGLGEQEMAKLLRYEESKRGVVQERKKAMKSRHQARQAPAVME